MFLSPVVVKKRSIEQFRRNTGAPYKKILICDLYDSTDFCRSAFFCIDKTKYFIKGRIMLIGKYDRSNYFEGLLLLIGKNRKISQSEKRVLMDLCKVLGIDEEVSTQKIDNAIDDQYIIDDPPVFSDSLIAKTLLKDGIHLAFADKNVHFYELEWLRAIASKNQISDYWLSKEISSFLDSKKAGTPFDLEIKKYVKHSLSAHS
jgi:hypothetical protein